LTSASSETISLRSSIALSFYFKATILYKVLDDLVN
jgi:hypothetical protein